MTYYQNYHKHTSLSHRYNKDSPLVPMNYFKHYAKLAHQGIPQIYSTVEHGWQSNYFHIYDDLEKFNKEQLEKNPNYKPIKFIFGTEGYWVKDRFMQDNTNCHIVLLAKNDNGRKKINRAIYESFKSGYYYKGRMDLDILLSLPKDDVFVTSACVAFWGYGFEETDEIILKLFNHFTDFYLEVQAHNTEKQKEINKHILELHKKYNIPIISATDSHIIEPSQMDDREDLLRSNHINYPDEENWDMDCPSYEVLYERFKTQGVLSDEQITMAINNTNKILDFEDIVLDRSLKVPTPKMLKGKTQEERNEIFKQIVREEWNKQLGDINKDKISEYKKEIQYNVSEIIKSNMTDYFLTNYYTMKLGQTKEYGGILTPSGRGSGVSFFINKILGFTKVDKINSPVTMYAERFLTATRIIESKNAPDIDHNVSDREPFKKAQDEVLGIQGFDLLALGTLHYKSAFKMYSRAYNVEPTLANEVTKQIAKYESAIKHAEDDDERELIDIFDYVNKEQYGYLIDGCQQYMGIVDNIKSHPCFDGNELVLTSNGYKKIKDINIGDYVLTKDNSYQQVLKVMNHTTDSYYNLKLQGSPKIKVTPNHPFLTCRPKHKTIEKTEWKEVKDLEEGDFIGHAINQNSILPNLDFVDSSNCDFWWTIGRYFGDGWRSHTVRRSGKYKGKKEEYVVICCDKTEKELNEILPKLSWTNGYWIINEKTTYRVNFKKINGFYEWLGEFGDKADGKHLTNTIINLPIEQLSAFIEGYFSADGSIINDKYYTFKTVSKELALGISQCVMKCYHRYCSVMEGKPPRTEIIRNRTVNCKQQYIGTFKKTNDKLDRCFYKDGIIWSRYVNKELIEEPLQVYNLSVNNNNTYTVNNIIVHNCGYLAYDGDIIEDVGVIMVKSESTNRECFVALQESSTIDYFGYLKQDYLIVDSIGLTYDIYKEIGIEPMSVNQLLQTIDGNKKVWDIYANGYTMCINQAEQPKSTEKVMRYKPKNISELTQWIAGIRPSFQTMYKIFESRQHFDYGIKAFDEIIQDEYCSSSFILYQETLMKVLGFAGFPMTETYTIIKAISKKKAKVIASAKEKFIPNFSQAILNTKETDDIEIANQMAEKVWKVIENSASYGFNASHAFCMAIDSVTLAYLKAYYPLEFYKIALQRYTDKGNKNKVANLKKEMLRMGIKVNPIRFGDDNRTFSINYDTNSINQTMSSIKDMQKIVPPILYELGKKKYKDFNFILKDINKTEINKKSLDILVKLDYFKEYGDINYLLSQIEVYKETSNIFNKLKDCKQLKKADCEYLFLTEEQVRKCCKTETPKLFKDIDNEALYHIAVSKYKDIMDKISEKYPYKETTIKDRIIYDIKLLGYTDLTDSTADENLFIVEDIEVNNYGTTFLKIYSLKYGYSKQVKVARKWWEECKCEIGDIVKCCFETKNKRTFVEGSWIESPETEEVLKVFSVQNT